MSSKEKCAYASGYMKGSDKCNEIDTVNIPDLINRINERMELIKKSTKLTDVKKNLIILFYHGYKDGIDSYYDNLNDELYR
ncbi:MAG: hypothetical protein WCR97_03920 [Bacilli bacterium]